MTRGLLWLPLLLVFIGLAWAGWNEYQKLEAYRLWAQQFDRAKYDIYSVLGQKGDQLTWGKPTRRGPIDLQSFSLDQVRSIELTVEGQAIDPSHPPTNGRQISLVFHRTTELPIAIPFTEIPLAASWATHLQQQLKIALLNRPDVPFDAR